MTWKKNNLIYQSYLTLQIISHNPYKKWQYDNMVKSGFIAPIPLAINMFLHTIAFLAYESIWNNLWYISLYNSCPVHIRNLPLCQECADSFLAKAVSVSMLFIWHTIYRDQLWQMVYNVSSYAWGVAFKHICWTMLTRETLTALYIKQLRWF